MREELLEMARNLLFRRQRNYKLTFGSEAGKHVLADLAKFCRANDTAFHADPRVHAALEGRREVFLRIMQHIKLSPDELAALRGVDQ